MPSLYARSTGTTDPSIPAPVKSNPAAGTTGNPDGGLTISTGAGAVTVPTAVMGIALGSIGTLVLIRFAFRNGGTA